MVRKYSCQHYTPDHLGKMGIHNRQACNRTYNWMFCFGHTNCHDANNVLGNCSNFPTMYHYPQFFSCHKNCSLLMCYFHTNNPHPSLGAFLSLDRLHLLTNNSPILLIRNTLSLLLLSLMPPFSSSSSVSVDIFLLDYNYSLM